MGRGKKTKRSTTEDELSSSCASSTDEDTFPDETTPSRRRRSEARRNTSKEDMIIMMLADLQRSHRKMRKELKKLSGRYDSLSKQLELHNNGTSGDGGSTAQRSSISNQAQPGKYELVFTSGNIGVPFENGKKKNTEYKIDMGQTIDITVALVDRADRDNETVENGHQPASVRVELFVLDDKAFNQHVRQSNYWSIEEFERCIRTTTTKQYPAQRKSVEVTSSQFNLIHGVGSHSCSINVNSGNSKFRLAVREVSSTKERVLLVGFSNPFYVRDLAKPNKQKQKRPMTDSNQADRITMNTCEEQRNLQGSSTMYSAQQSTTTNAEHTMTGQYQPALPSQMWPQTMNNQAANTSEAQPQVPVPCHGSNDMYSTQPCITSAEQAFPGQYQSTLHSHPMLAQAMNSQAAMYTSEVQRQHIDRGNSAVYSILQDQALLTGNYELNHHLSELAQALSNQIGMPDNNRNETTFPLRILWDRPDVELSKPCWNIHDHLMLLQSGQQKLSTTRLIPEQSGSLTVTPKEVMQTACRKRGVRIESLEPDNSDEERPLKRKLHSKYRFRFVNKVCEAYYTWDQIKADDGNFLKVALFDENNTMITSGPLSSASVEVVVLHGDFDIEGQDSWTSEEFASFVVCPRPENSSVLGGDLTLVLAHGEACLRDVFFQIASICARTEKFKLGVRLASSQEERIRQGISESFLVKDRPFADAARNLHHQGANGNYLPFHLSPGPVRLSKMFLEFVTKNFADEMKVGSGAFGIVYKGSLDNGQVIAVKKLHPLKVLDDIAFDNELRNLCKIRHQNIIRILGYCHEPQRKILTHKGPKNAVREMERFLCFKYMEHGSIEKHISDNSCDLDWPTCFKIIKGICEGLHYLHSAQENPIYHLDLKPANILLDENMAPKIADFGLSRLFASTATYETMNSRGTHGYMPPEYIDSGIISRKFDVFSLGVIIIQILTGNRDYSRRYEMSQKQFTELVTINWKGKLQGTSGYSSREINIQQVKTCINMALRCVDADRNRRPYIEDIVNEVKEIEAQNVTMSLYSAQSTDLIGLQNKRMMVEIKEEMHNMGKVIITTLKEEFKEELKLSSEIHKKIEKITESVNDLSKQLELHINDTSGDESAASRPQSSQVQPPRYRLVFKSGVPEKIETGQTMEISVALIDGHNGQTVENGPLASATVELVVVNAEFNQHNNQYNWSTEDFVNSIKKARQGNFAAGDVDQSVRSVVSDGRFNLVQGAKCHSGSKIFSNSSNKKVRLGVMMVSPTEERVLEGLSNLFFVRGHDRPARQSNLRHNRSNTQRQDLVDNGYHQQNSPTPNMQNPSWPNATQGGGRTNRNSVLFSPLGMNSTTRQLELPFVSSGLNLNEEQQLPFQGNTPLLSTEPSTSEEQRASIQHYHFPHLETMAKEATNNQYGKVYQGGPRNSECQTQVWRPPRTTASAGGSTARRTSLAPSFPGTGSKNSSKNATDTSTFGTKTSVSSSSMPPTPRTETEILESSNLRKFTFSELKDATRNFSPDSLIGEGGFGSVFKGWIDDERTLAPVKPGTGMIAAVKKLKLDSFQGHREWLAEVNYLGQLSHPNLVKLIGYCLEDEQRLLVYEYMPGGNLEDRLFSGSSNFQPLQWNLRIKVALEAARGLAFLHDQDKVIFRDFKASNILLDSEYNAKLADFGLAKYSPIGDKSHVSTRVMGTQGYAAPEYLATGHLTAKSDVYSYGVVLLELMSGQRALDKNRPPGQHNLVEWARPYITNNRRVIHVLDSRLGSQYSLSAAQKMAALALQCLSMDARCRPGMDQAVTVLEELQEAKGQYRMGSKDLATVPTIQELWRNRASEIRSEARSQ